MSNMLDDLPSKSIPALLEIQEQLMEEEVMEEVDRVRLEEALRRLDNKKAVRASQIRMVTDELTRRNPA